MQFGETFRQSNENPFKRWRRAGIAFARRALHQVSRKLRFRLPPAHKSSIKLNVNKFASHAVENQIPVSVVALPTSQHKVAQLMAQKAKEKCNKVSDFRRLEETLSDGARE